MDKKIAVVTGANRGLGLETARQLLAKGMHVIVTARDESKGKAAVEKLRASRGAGGGEVDFYPLDVTESRSIDGLVDYLEGEFGRVDVLVNNAGIFMEGEDLDSLRKSMETNVYGPYLLIRKILPIMKKQGSGRIVNLSSGMGQLSEMNGGYPAYRLSKTAINVLTRVFADEVQGTDILVNSVCPGWVKTDMGGPNAELSVAEGADTIVWAATLPKGGPSGGFFRERKALEW